MELKILDPRQTCANCRFNDGHAYMSDPVKYRCTFDNKWYQGSHPCHFELAPIIHGSWIPVSDDDQYEGRYYCSNCNHEVFFGDDILTNYCEACGSDMRKVNLRVKSKDDHPDYWK